MHCFVGTCRKSCITDSDYLVNYFVTHKSLEPLCFRRMSTKLVWVPDSPSSGQHQRQPTITASQSSPMSGLSAFYWRRLSPMAVCPTLVSTNQFCLSWLWIFSYYPPPPFLAKLGVGIIVELLCFFSFVCISVPDEFFSNFGKFWSLEGGLLPNS